MALKVFRELTMRGSRESILSLLRAAATNLPTDWAGPKSEDRDRYHYQTFDVGPELIGQTAKIFLSERDGWLELVNIVPQSVQSLSIDQYNQIAELLTSVLRPLAASFGVSLVELGSSAELTRWLSPRAADALTAFSELANKSTGSGHPQDFKRWATFLIYCHRDGCDLSTDLLQQFLTHEQEWDDEMALKLALQFEFGLRLLKQENAM